MRTHRFTLSFLPVLAVAGLVTHHGRPGPAPALGATAGRAMVRLGVDRLAAAPGVPSVLAALSAPTPFAAAPTPFAATTTPFAATTTPFAATTTTTAPAPPHRPPTGPAPANAPATAPTPVGPRPLAGTAPLSVEPTTTTTTGPVAPSAAVWAALRRCESGDDYGADTGNGYYGAYQFSLTTWHWLGYAGYPDQTPPATQDSAAARLEALRGWSQWPACARALGLR